MLCPHNICILATPLFFLIGKRVYRYSVSMLTICTTSLVIGTPATQYLLPRGFGALLELLIISLKCGPTYDVTTHEWLRKSSHRTWQIFGISNSHKISSTKPNFNSNSRKQTATICRSITINSEDLAALAL